MPGLASHGGNSPIPASVDDWRPQGFGRGRSVSDPIIEPRWGGLHVLARLESRKLRFFDEDGIDCTEEFADLAHAVEAAALTDDAIFDGYLTIEPTQPAEGSSPADAQVPGAGENMAALFVGEKAIEASRRRRLDTDRPIAFVAVDLLRIDGTVLLDLPLLERKRLLDGGLEPGELVRITPYVRPPISSFANTWKGLGFSELAYKGANSRYFPGGRNDEWIVAPIPKR